MSKHQILVLGSGLVAAPFVKYFLNKPNYFITIASNQLEKAQELAQGNNAKPVYINVEDKQKLDNLIKESDIVVSLLPYVYHPIVAEFCVKHSKNLVTTSYVSAAMRNFDQEAKSKGLIFLNEIGLDPGIDHMSAKKIIDSAKRKGGKIRLFRSYCGGLPALDANDNPMGYKFSWSPKGVLLAIKNNAKYLEDGKIISIPNSELFKHYWYVTVPNLGVFEVYPNRDSMPYIDLYKISETFTMFRGTLRYPGWCQFWEKINALGLLDDTERHDLTNKTWKQLMRELVPGNSDLVEDLANFWKVAQDSDVIKRVKWLGLLDDTPINTNYSCFLDLLCAQLIDKLQYKPHERDMVVLFHEFIIEYSETQNSDKKYEYVTSTLVDYGIPNGDSAMSRTVALPAAIAVKNILEKKFKTYGVIIPVISEIYEPVLSELESYNIKCVEVYKQISQSKPL